MYTRKAVDDLKKLWSVGDLLQLFMAEQCEKSCTKEMWAKILSHRKLV